MQAHLLGGCLTRGGWLVQRLPRSGFSVAKAFRTADKSSSRVLSQAEIFSRPYCWMVPPLADSLREQRERTSAIEREQSCIIVPVFHRNGKPILSYVRAWKAACKAAGLTGRLVHDLRRTAVRNLERAGVSRSVAMKLTGHKTEAVYRRYAITSAADLSEGVAKLAVLHNATAGARRMLPFVTGTKRAQSAG